MTPLPPDNASNLLFWKRFLPEDTNEDTLQDTLLIAVCLDDLAAHRVRRVPYTRRRAAYSVRLAASAPRASVMTYRVSC